MVEYVDKEILLVILDNEGCVIDYTNSREEYPNFSSIHIISPCNKYSCQMDGGVEDYTRTITEYYLNKLGLSNIADIIPYRVINFSSDIKQDI